MLIAWVPELVLLFDDVADDGGAAVALRGLPLEVGVVFVPVVDVRYPRSTRRVCSGEQVTLATSGRTGRRECYPIF